MTSATRALCLRAFVWVLIGLVPVQSIAAGVLATRGPAHVHRPADAVQLELEDFRRLPARAVARDVHVGAAIGHFHASLVPERHPHARGDASVVRAADDAANPLADDDTATLGAALGAWAPIVAAVAGWHASPVTDALPARRGWPSLDHDPEPLDRPPRGD